MTTPQESAEAMLDKIREVSPKDASSMVRLSIKADKLHTQAEQMEDKVQDIALQYGYGICANCFKWINIQSALHTKDQERVCLDCVASGDVEAIYSGGYEEDV